jgi:ferric-dicitrate binding protein FerR (iron transport regulator)
LDGGIKRTKQPDVARATAWSTRRLKFDNTDLEDVVDEFNRYQRNTRLRVEGVAPGSHHYSGIFDPDAPEAFGRLLAREPDLSVDIGATEIIIRPRSPNEMERAEK